MDNMKYAEIRNLLVEELNGDRYGASVLAMCIDNIVFNARMEKNDTFIKDVVIALVDAYWQGYAQHETECQI